MGFDSLSLVGLAPGTELTGTWEVEAYEERRWREERRVDLVTQNGVRVYTLPLSLVAAPRTFEVFGFHTGERALDTGRRFRVTSATRDGIEIDFGAGVDDNPGDAVLPVLIRAAV